MPNSFRVSHSFYTDYHSCNLKEKYSAIALFSVLLSLTLLLPMDQFLRIDVIGFINARFLLTETMYISSR